MFQELSFTSTWLEACFQNFDVAEVVINISAYSQIWRFKTIFKKNPYICLATYLNHVSKFGWQFF
jgi:hypothetical protein